MNSKNHIKNHISKLDLKPLKHTKNKSHLFADYFEIICLFGKDEVTLNDFLDKYRKEKIELVKVSLSDSEIGSSSSERNDKEELWADEVFAICDRRYSILGDIYPFTTSNNALKLKKNPNDLNKLYLFMLLASNLNYFPDFEASLTQDFEELCCQSLKTFMPNNSIIKQLGKNSDLKGTAKEKIRTLADMMNIRLNSEEIKNNIQGNMERGLDIIGWTPFNDKIPNMITILGQCACGKEWYKKQGETRRYENAYYKFYKNKPIHESSLKTY